MGSVNDLNLPIIAVSGGIRQSFFGFWCRRVYYPESLCERTAAAQVKNGTHLRIGVGAATECCSANNYGIGGRTFFNFISCAHFS